MTSLIRNILSVVFISGLVACGGGSVSPSQTDNGQDASDNGQDASDNGQDASDNGQDASDNGQDASDNGQDAADNGQDAAGNISQVPTIASVSDPDGVIPNGGESQNGLLVIKGQLSAASSSGSGNLITAAQGAGSNAFKVVVYSGENLIEGSMVLDGLQWTFTSKNALPDGTHSLRAVMTSLDGVPLKMGEAFTVRVNTTGSSITPHNHSLPSLAFNQNTWPSDTQGSLLGTVLFAQSQIIPAQTRIPGDLQPSILASRDTLVLFKPDPSVQLAKDKGIAITAYSSGGYRLGSVNMKHPNDIPKTPLFQNNLDVSALNFDTGLVKPREVNTQAELSKLEDPKAEFLKGLLANNNAVRISLNDGAWVGEIHLPAGDYTGKKIVVVRNSGYGSTVKYPLGSNSAGAESLSAGKSTAFAPIAKAGWATKADIEHSRYVYGKNFWSAVLKKEWIQPGLKLQFSQGLKTGTLNFAANGVQGVKMGAPTELLLHVIDVGMLIPPRGKFEFAKDDSAHQEYFQTLPVSRLIVSRYESVHFEQVVMPNGAVHTPGNPDPSSGGWHTGGMREYIGKELVSLGIDHANYGISSSRSTGGTYPFWTAQITAHNTIGKYANGNIIHGGSGGGGIVTLDSSIGNEFSHELGHNYGLGHYEGGAKGTIHRPANDVNSTWGWDSKRNILIPNFNKTPPAPKISFSPVLFQSNCLPIGVDTNQSDCVAPFQIDDNLAYSFGNDSMGGGEPPWPSINRFTMYTPYTALKIQKFLESKAVFDKSSSTGFRKWNANTLQMDEAVMSIPDALTMNANPLQANTSTPDLYTQYLQGLFDKGADIVDLNMGDGSWRSEVIVPPASANAGKIFRVKHSASWVMTLTIDGVTIVFNNQTPQKIFQSDGSKWIALAQFEEPKLVRKPELFGVPVVTIVGFYDPQKTLPSYIYPALHGAYGFVYPSENLNPSSKGCLLQVSTNNGATRLYKLKAYRLTDGQMNRFQVNIPRSENPHRAEVVCDGQALDSKNLSPAKDPASLTYTVNGMPLPK
jgi:hypothetical protein